MIKKLRAILPLLFLLLLSACSQQPGEVHYGNDECAHCKMIITDSRFASEMVSSKGKAIKFDAIECMAEYAGSHKTELNGAKGYVSNFDHPGEWLALDKAIIVQSRNINSPMGAGLVALEDEEALKIHQEEYSGVQVKWQALVK